MTKSRFHALLPLALGLLSSSPVAAQGLRCGDRLASTGSTTYEVRATCGEPDAAERRIELRTVRVRIPAPCYEVRGQWRCYVEVEQTIEVIVDRWTYDFGRNRFIQYASFEDDRLTTVADGGYGSKP